MVYWRTIYQNSQQLIKQSRRWRGLMARFKAFDPDLVFTDFESVTALMAKIKKKPLVSIDNQHQLTNTKIEITEKYKKDLMVDKLIIKSLVWGANYYLVTSFFETPITKKNTFLFSPVIRREVSSLQSNRGDYILVYQNSNFKSVIKVLKNFSDYRFVIFGLNFEGQEGNLTFHNYDTQGWLKYLANCRAVIGTAGLSLITESLYLRKPYLAIPVRRQIEQIVNAQYLQRKGYGLFTYQLKVDDFQEFIKKLPKFEANLNVYRADGQENIFQKIDEIINQLT